MKHSTHLFVLPFLLGFLGLCSLARQALVISHNGGVCNYSSKNIWLTLTESGKQKAYGLPPGTCTDVSTQDAEAIWGSDCTANPCQYQAWKVGAGRFAVYDGKDPLSASVLRLKGWGIGSRWHITRDWPKPDLLAIGYSLTR